MDHQDLFNKLTGASITYADNRHLIRDKSSAFMVLISDECGEMAEAYGATIELAYDKAIIQVCDVLADRKAIEEEPHPTLSAYERN